jgi:hypothetical protein
MSRLNGDRARFHKNRRNKLRRRQRVRAMIKAFHAAPADKAAVNAEVAVETVTVDALSGQP